MPSSQQPPALSAIQDRAARVFAALNARYPAPKPLLDAGNPWQLLVATVLSAQCTDARVNMVTPGLFARWPGPAELMRASQEDVEEVVRSTGFFRNKAKNLRETARLVMERHNGTVPATMEELTSLPGLARKTANIVLWGGYGINAGLAVDTHVKRIAYRLGLTTNTDQDKVERDLMALYPPEQWGPVNHHMVLFGREVCDARAPKCGDCEFLPVCPQEGVRKSSGTGQAAGKAAKARKNL